MTEKHHNHAASKKKGFHKDWRVWSVVVLMLGAMAIYVLSFDERFRIGGSPNSVNPPAAAPAAK
jgi:hypothetical protein